MKTYVLSTLFYLLFFLLMSSTLCKKVFASDETELVASENSIELFQTGQIKKVLKENGQNGEETSSIDVKDYYSPFLLSTTDVIIALAGVNSNGDDDDKCITVLTNYTFKESDKNLWEKMGKDKSAGKWKTQLAAEKQTQCKSKPNVLKGFIAVAQKGKLYILLVNCCNNEGDNESNEIQCNFEIHVGNLDSDNTNGKKLSWKKSESSLVSSPYAVQSLSEEDLKCKHPIFGTAFITKEEHIIFVVKAKNNNGEKIIAFVRSKNEENEFEVVLNNDISKECLSYIFPWNEKIIKVSLDCPKNSKTSITESTDTELKWSATKEPLFKLADFLIDKKDFFAVNSEREKFIFFTQQIKTEPPNGKVYLWISDGIRATKAGEITSNLQSTASFDFFYTNDELFVFAKTCGGSKTNNVCLTRLKGQTEQIKIVLNAWNIKENKFKELCPDNTDKNIYCHTNDLVGFLSDTLNGSNDKEWKDEYYYKNAIVTGGVTKTDGGITFTGKNANAQWLVSKEQIEQPYDFNKFGFTLVTIVTINKAMEENTKYNSILGVSFVTEENTIGLLCNEKGQWVMGKEKDQTKAESTSKNCKIGSTYQVVLIYEQDKKMSVYINGTQLSGIPEKITTIAETDNIGYFYFGVEKKQKQNDVETHVTIKNVLLYNRPFNKDEIVSLEVNKKDTSLNAGTDKNKNNVAEQQSDGDNLEINEGTIRGGSGGSELTQDTPNGDVVPSFTVQRESAVYINVSIMCGVWLMLFVATQYQYV